MESIQQKYHTEFFVFLLIETIDAASSMDIEEMMFGGKL